MKGAVYSSRSALYTGLFENGVRRAEKGAECELYHQTEGNALFLEHLLEHLLEQGVVK